MSIKKLSLLKLKKQCQDTFYQSIDDTLQLSNSQTYLPAFTHALNIDNDYSKKMFILNSKYVLLQVSPELEESKKEEPELNLDLDIDLDQERPSKLKFGINETLQGNIRGKIVNKKLYTKSKDYQDYSTYIADIPMFIKSNPLLDIISYMEDKYEFNSSIPSIFSYLTNKKINDINNNAYLEVLAGYFLNLINENELCTLFPHFYGAFNGIAENYVHDISEDYPHIRGCEWFSEKNEKLRYEIIRDNNLDDYQELSLKNIKKVDYDTEKDLKHKEDMELEINDIMDCDIVEDIDLNMTDLVDEITCLKGRSGDNTESLNEGLDSGSDSNSDYDSNSGSGSGSDWSDISSNESCIFNETYIKIQKFPVQILAMERLEITLTKLIKEGISIEEWKGILFEICFGMAIAQKTYSFVHNDLHSDNIMFKTIKEDYKYYQYQNTYFKVPTFGRETKVIDFARAILKVNGKTYFSDVFKKEGDAGGQYNYLQNQSNKKYNFSFDLARLGTTIAEFLNDSSEKEELFNLITEWTTNKDGDSFLEMEDDFSLYVSICETANKAVPRNQLTKDIFKLFVIDKNKIPESKKIYVLE